MIASESNFVDDNQKSLPGNDANVSFMSTEETRIKVEFVAAEKLVLPVTPTSSGEVSSPLSMGRALVFLEP